MIRKFFIENGLPVSFISIKPWKSLPEYDKKNICISVCASNWNRPLELIIKSLESFLKQKMFSPENYEIILVDDASDDDNAKKSIEYLSDVYKNNRLKFYRTSYSRCWSDAHVLNVAYKRARGKIILQNQTDVVQVGETLEASWRHHNQVDNLWLCPLSFRQRDISLLQRPQILYPHELGASVKSKWITQIQGRNELIKVIPADVDFHLTLNKIGVVFGIDWSINTIHADHESIPRIGSDKPEPTPWPGIGLRNNNLTWSEDWGVLTQEEELNSF